jgi:hypothetical protein
MHEAFQKKRRIHYNHAKLTNMTTNVKKNFQNTIHRTEVTYEGVVLSTGKVCSTRTKTVLLTIVSLTKFFLAICIWFPFRKEILEKHYINCSFEPFCVILKENIYEQRATF